MTDGIQLYVVANWAMSSLLSGHGLLDRQRVGPDCLVGSETRRDLADWLSEPRPWQAHPSVLALDAG